MAAAARPAPSVRMKKYLGKCWLLNRISENWDKKLCAFFNSDYLESPHLIFYELQPGPEYDFENCPITYFVPMLDASCQDCFIQAEFDDGSNFKHGVKIGVGLVLEGDSVRHVLSGGPADRDFHGQKIEPGDEVLTIEENVCIEASSRESRVAPGCSLRMKLKKPGGLGSFEANIIRRTPEIEKLRCLVHSNLDLNEDVERVMQQVDAVISQSTQEVDRLTKHIHGLEDCLRQYVSDSSGEMLFLWRQLQAAIDHTHPLKHTSRLKASESDPGISTKHTSATDLQSQCKQVRDADPDWKIPSQLACPGDVMAGASRAGKLAAAIVDSVSGGLASESAESSMGRMTTAERLPNFSRLEDALVQAASMLDRYAAVVELRLSPRVADAAVMGTTERMRLVDKLEAEISGVVGAPREAVRVVCGYQAQSCSAAVVFSAWDEDDDDDDDFVLFGDACTPNVRTVPYLPAAAIGVGGVHSARGPRLLAQRLVEAVRGRSEGLDGWSGQVLGASFLGLMSQCTVRALLTTYGARGWMLQCEKLEVARAAAADLAEQIISICETFDLRALDDHDFLRLLAICGTSTLDRHQSEDSDASSASDANFPIINDDGRDCSNHRAKKSIPSIGLLTDTGTTAASWTAAEMDSECISHAYSFLDCITGVLPPPQQTAVNVNIAHPNPQAVIAKIRTILDRAECSLDQYSAVVELRLSPRVADAAVMGTTERMRLVDKLEAEISGVVGAPREAVRVVCGYQAQSCGAAVVFSAWDEDDDEDDFVLFGDACTPNVRTVPYLPAAAIGVGGVHSARGPRLLAQRLVEAVRGRSEGLDGWSGQVLGASFLGLMSQCTVRALLTTYGARGWMLQCEKLEVQLARAAAADSAGQLNSKLDAQLLESAAESNSFQMQNMGQDNIFSVSDVQSTGSLQAAGKSELHTNSDLSCEPKTGPKHHNSRLEGSVGMASEASVCEAETNLLLMNPSDYLDSNGLTKTLEDDIIVILEEICDSIPLAGLSAREFQGTKQIHRGASDAPKKCLCHSLTRLKHALDHFAAVVELQVSAVYRTSEELARFHVALKEHIAEELLLPKDLLRIEYCFRPGLPTAVVIMLQKRKEKGSKEKDSKGRSSSDSMILQETILKDGNISADSELDNCSPLCVAKRLICMIGKLEVGQEGLRGEIARLVKGALFLGLIPDSVALMVTDSMSEWMLQCNRYESELASARVSAGLLVFELSVLKEVLDTWYEKDQESNKALNRFQIEHNAKSTIHHTDFEESEEKGMTGNTGILVKEESLSAVFQNEEGKQPDKIVPPAQVTCVTSLCRQKLNWLSYQLRALQKEKAELYLELQGMKMAFQNLKMEKQSDVCYSVAPGLAVRCPDIVESQTNTNFLVSPRTEPALAPASAHPRAQSNWLEFASIGKNFCSNSALQDSNIDPEACTGVLRRSDNEPPDFELPDFEDKSQYPAVARNCHYVNVMANQYDSCRLVNIQNEVLSLKNETHSKLRNLKRGLRIIDQQLEVISHEKRQMSLKVHVAITHALAHHTYHDSASKASPGSVNNSFEQHLSQFTLNRCMELCAGDKAKPVYHDNQKSGTWLKATDSQGIEICSNESGYDNSTESVDSLHRQVCCLEAALKTSEEMRSNLYSRLAAALNAADSYQEQICAIESARKVERAALQKLEANFHSKTSEVQALMQQQRLLAKQCCCFSNALCREQTKVSILLHVCKAMNFVLSLYETDMKECLVQLFEEYSFHNCLSRKSDGDLKVSTVYNVCVESRECLIQETMSKVVELVVLNEEEEKRIISRLEEINAHSSFENRSPGTLPEQPATVSDLAALGHLKSVLIVPHDINDRILILLNALINSETARAKSYGKLEIVLDAVDSFQEQIAALESARIIDKQIRNENNCALNKMKQVVSKSRSEKEALEHVESVLRNILLPDLHWIVTYWLSSQAASDSVFK